MSSPPDLPALNDDGLPLAPMTWAEPCDGRYRRVFQIDITTCPDFGGRLRWPADITVPSLMRKILLHVHFRAPPPDRSLDASRPQRIPHFTRSG